ncbi:hypothetical protein GCM10027059_26750 [Myceligenerans halotolerans]
MTTDQTKTCTQCGETKALDEFSPHPNCLLGRDARCKFCKAANARRRYKEYPERQAEIQRRYRWKHTDEVRERDRRKNRKRYEIDPEKERARVRAYREATQSQSLPGATNRNKQWTGPELEMAADLRRTAAEVALSLGRTVRGVEAMRHKLRTDPRKIKVAGIPERDEP